MSNFRYDKEKTIKNLRNFVIKNGIKDKADSFIEKSIKNANKSIEKLNGNMDFLHHYSNIIFQRNN